MVEVFRTTVKEQGEAWLLVHTLTEHFPGCKINFDLEDCDNILRMEGDTVETGKVVELLKQYSYSCQVLD